jgi:hypothetical protein
MSVYAYNGTTETGGDSLTEDLNIFYNVSSWISGTEEHGADAM